MELIQIADKTFRFKGRKCSDCCYRFHCWTSLIPSCPLKIVRVAGEELGDDHLFMKFKAARVWYDMTDGWQPDNIDRTLLGKIGEDLRQIYEQSQQKS